MKAQAEAVHGKKIGDNASGIVQAIGGGLALVGLPFLFISAIQKGSATLIVGIAVYSASILGYFSLSSVAHFLGSERARKVFAILEEAGSFLLIAGSLTPLCLDGIGGPVGWLAFGLLWGFGAIGFLATLFRWGVFARLAFPAYLLFFTLVAPLLPPLGPLLSAQIRPWLFVAGLSFSMGLFFRKRGGMPYNHAIWHCFTGAASILLYFALLALF